MVNLWEGYAVVFDVNKYAGNFERQMVAYITGIVGDCGAGIKESNSFKEECGDLNFGGVVRQVPDEHGCYRPASIVPSPYYWNDGMGNCHPNTKQSDDPSVVSKHKKSLQDRADHVKKVYSHMPEYAEQEYQRVLKDEFNQKIHHFPAYMSVICFLFDEPDSETLDTMVDRAKKFCKQYTDHRGVGGLKLLGVRVLRRTYQDEELSRIEINEESA